MITFIPVSEMRKVEQHKLFTFIFYFFTGTFSLATFRWEVNKDKRAGLSERRKSNSENTALRRGAISIETRVMIRFIDPYGV